MNKLPVVSSSSKQAWLRQQESARIEKAVARRGSKLREREAARERCLPVQAGKGPPSRDPGVLQGLPGTGSLQGVEHQLNMHHSTGEDIAVSSLIPAFKERETEAQGGKLDAALGGPDPESDSADE